MSEEDYKLIFDIIVEDEDPKIGASKVKRLLMEGIDPNAKNDKGFTPLFMAVNWDNYEITKTLIEGGADMNIRTRMNTPLGVALSRGNLDIIKLFVEMGGIIPESRLYHEILSLKRYIPSLRTLAKRSIIKHKIYHYDISDVIFS